MRQLAQLDSDFEHLEKQIRLAEESCPKPADDSEQLGVPDIKDLVAQASLEIKQNAARRKRETEEEIALEIMGLRADGRHDEFKNI